MWIITNLGLGLGYWAGSLISLVLVCLYCTAEMEGWMDGRIKGRRGYQSRGMDRILFPQSLRLNGR